MAEERRPARRDAKSASSVSLQAAQQEHQTREYVARLSNDKQASVKFLKEAGILNSRGSLAKPYRG